MQRIFWILILLNVLLVLASGFLLPEKVASHFDLSGQPNGWTSKTGFIVSGLVLCLCLVLWVPIGFLIKNCPPQFFNVPNKDYWLRDENVLQFRRNFSFWWWTMGCIVITFFLFTFLMVILINLQKNPVLGDEIWFLTGYFFLSTGLSIAYLYYVFRTPKEDIR